MSVTFLHINTKLLALRTPAEWLLQGVILEGPGVRNGTEQQARHLNTAEGPHLLCSSPSVQGEIFMISKPLPGRRLLRIEDRFLTMPYEALLACLLGHLQPSTLQPYFRLPQGPACLQPMPMQGPSPRPPSLSALSIFQRAAPSLQ